MMARAVKLYLLISDCCPCHSMPLFVVRFSPVWLEPEPWFSPILVCGLSREQVVGHANESVWAAARQMLC
jgi:hypothetical protein